MQHERHCREAILAARHVGRAQFCVVQHPRTLDLYVREVRAGDDMLHPPMPVPGLAGRWGGNAIITFPG
eukprot:3806448-Lingulodinium_polyedra.AAC.1